MGHRPQLDGLRAMAVMAVIWSHTTAAGAAADAGTAGVWLFYALSGFLITGILRDARDAAEAAGRPKARAWLAFWARRALRILPLYYAALALAILAGADETRRDWPWYAAHLTNLRFAATGDWPHATGHFWSLAVEEQFYLLWPPLVLWLPRRWATRAALAMVAAAPAWRMALPAAGYGPVAALTPTPCSLDGLGAGALLALSGAVPPGWAAAAAAGVATAAAGWGHPLDWAVRRLGYAVASWWLVGRAAAGFGGRAGRLLSSRVLGHVGRVSYGIYLIHNMVPAAASWSDRHLGTAIGFPAERGPAQCFWVACVSLGAASLSWRFFEAPINGLKRSFPYVVATAEGKPHAAA